MRKRQLPQGEVAEIGEFEFFNDHFCLLFTQRHDDVNKAFSGFQCDRGQRIVEFETNHFSIGIAEGIGEEHRVERDFKRFTIVCNFDKVDTFTDFSTGTLDLKLIVFTCRNRPLRISYTLLCIKKYSVRSIHILFPVFQDNIVNTLAQ